MSGRRWEMREFGAGAEAARERQTSRMLTLVLAMTLALVAGAIFWASQAVIEEVAVGQGKVIPSGEARAVQSLEGGIVKEILVSEGDDVTAGQVLLRIDDTRAEADRGELVARHRVLSLRAARLQAEAAGDEEPVFPETLAAEMPEAAARELVLFRSRRAALDSQTEILREQLQQNEQEVAELEAGAERIEASIALLDEEIRLQTASGVVPRARIIPLERERNERQRELGAVRSDIIQEQGETRAATARVAEAKLTFTATAREELAETLGELSVLDETLRAAEDVVVRSALRAPVDGIVTSMEVNTIGGVIAPGAEILRILPIGEALQVEARVRPEDIAFVIPGLKATVKLTAFDFTVYGALEGEVIRVGADSEEDERSGEVYFPIVVETRETSLKRFGGEEREIRPGMVAQVDILTGERTVLDYLLKPFRKAGYEAMRER
ncbi:MAG: HlyD family type I secretion periplasmic adaptor subunit [Pikeienuella sp.]